MGGLKIAAWFRDDKRGLFLALSLALPAVFMGMVQAQTIVPSNAAQSERSFVPPLTLAANISSHSKSERPIVVAVVDSGVHPDLPVLRGKLLPGVDMVSADRNPRNGRSADFSPDDKTASCPISNRKMGDAVFEHGSDVASAVAVNAGSSKVRILPVKVTGVCEASRGDLIDGLLWAAGFHIEGVQDNANPARIINISMAGGGTTCNPALQKAITSIVDKGIVIVSAAGNTFGGAAREPAVCGGVIGVGAINADQSKTYYTAVDERIATYAFGSSDLSIARKPDLNNSAQTSSCEGRGCSSIAPASVGDHFFGTSYSAALVSGQIARSLLK